MKKLAELNFDVHDYLANDEIEKIAEILATVSPEAKAFDIYSVDPSHLRNEDFAVIISDGAQTFKKFAHTCPELVELNLAVLANKQEELPTEVVKIAAHNLTRAAEDFNLEIPETLKSYMGAEFTRNKLASQNIDLADYHYKLAQLSRGQVQFALPDSQTFPINTPEQIEQAQTWFEKNANLMPSFKALAFSKNLYKQANALGVPVTSKQINKLASLDTDFNQDLADQLAIRKGYLTPNQQDVEELYDEYREKVAELEATEAVEALEYIDRKAGLNRVWGRGLYHPLEAVFSLEKVAFVLDGLEKSQLLDVVDDYTASELLGPDGEAVFESLPSPVKHAIKQLRN